MSGVVYVRHTYAICCMKMRFPNFIDHGLLRIIYYIVCIYLKHRSMRCRSCFNRTKAVWCVDGRKVCFRDILFIESLRVFTKVSSFFILKSSFCNLFFDSLLAAFLLLFLHIRWDVAGLCKRVFICQKCKKNVCMVYCMVHQNC